jgi:DNA polymerase-3 subunit epsilon
MKYLFFDTETSGLPRSYRASVNDLENWPRVVQLSWILTNEKGRKLSAGDYIIKPVGFSIPTSASRIHGITTQKACERGDLLELVLCRFMKDLFEADCFVCHNVEFDYNVLAAEMLRVFGKEFLSEMHSHCTMQESTDFCEIETPNGYKWPTLQELHEKLFGKKFSGAHNSAADVLATKKCFFALKEEGVIND